MTDVAKPKRPNGGRSPTRGGKNPNYKIPPGPSSAVPELSDRQMKLVDAYFLNGFNKRQALATAGYICDTNYAVIFGHPAVRAEIKARQEQLRERYQLDEDWVVQRLQRIADGDLAGIMQTLRENDYDLSCLTLDERYLITEFSEEVYVEGRGEDAKPVKKVKVKVADKLQALVTLCRKLGLFQDNVNVTGEMSLVERLQAGRNRAASEAKTEGGTE